MHLSFCEFQNPKNSIEKLFSCCPVVEELVLMDCKWINLQQSITISIPSLKRLTVGVDSVEEYYLDHLSCCVITIEAPALLSFNYTGFLTDQFYLTKISSSSSSSIEAGIHIRHHRFYREVSISHLYKFFKGLENMVSLTISNETAKVLSLVPNHLPVFHHLKYLNLNMNLNGRDLNGLLTLLYFTPNLGTIRFSKGIDQTVRTAFAGRRWMQQQPVQECFFLSLKNLVLEKFHGHSYEFSFLNSFLEKALSLQRIHLIDQSKDMNVVNEQRCRENLEKLSTRFKHCEIIVE